MRCSEKPIRTKCAMTITMLAARNPARTKYRKGLKILISIDKLGAFHSDWSAVSHHILTFFKFMQY